MNGGGRGEVGVERGEARGWRARASSQPAREAREASGSAIGSTSAIATGAASAAGTGRSEIGGVGCSPQGLVSLAGAAFGQVAARWRAQLSCIAAREQPAPWLATRCEQDADIGRHSRTSAGSEAAIAKRENARTAGGRIRGSLQQDACPSGDARLERIDSLVRTMRGIAALCLCVALAAPLGAPAAAGAAGTRINHALLLDGSGAPGRPGSLRIEGDRIVAVAYAPSRSRRSPARCRSTPGDSSLAPGFIDTHTRTAPGRSSSIRTRSRRSARGSRPSSAARTATRTSRSPTSSRTSSANRRRSTSPPTAGHGTIRVAVLGEDFRRAATAAEIERRCAAAARRDGGRGARPLDRPRVRPRDLLDDRASSSSWRASRLAAGGRYISHVRSEDREFWEAIDEILTIGREARLPVQISHVKLAMRALWGEAPRLLALLDEARQHGIDVTADIYPYLYWHCRAHGALPGSATSRAWRRPSSRCARSCRPRG